MPKRKALFSIVLSPIEQSFLLHRNALQDRVMGNVNANSKNGEGRYWTEAQEQARDYLLKECLPRGIALCMYTTASLSLLKSGTKLRMSAISHSQGILQSEAPILFTPWGLAQASPEQVLDRGDIELEERNSRPWKATLLNGKKQGLTLEALFQFPFHSFLNPFTLLSI